MVKRGNSKIVWKIVILLLVIIIALISLFIVDKRVLYFTESTNDEFEAYPGCLTNSVEITDALKLSNNTFDVTVFRKEYDSEIDGIKLVFSSQEDSFIYSVPGDIARLQNISLSVIIPLENDILNKNITKVEAMVYFSSDSGDNIVCSVSDKVSSFEL